MEELTELGAIVHTCARNEDELRKCLRDWKDEGLRVTGSVCDVSSLADRGKLIEDVSSVFSGKLNILVSLFFIHPFIMFLVYLFGLILFYEVGFLCMYISRCFGNKYKS